MRSRLTLAWIGKDIGNCHLTLPIVVFSPSWGATNYISQAFRRIQREANVLSACLTVWEEMVGVRPWHGGVKLRTSMLLHLFYNGAFQKQCKLLAGMKFPEFFFFFTNSGTYLDHVAKICLSPEPFYKLFSFC